MICEECRGSMLKIASDVCKQPKSNTHLVYGVAVLIDSDCVASVELGATSWAGGRELSEEMIAVILTTIREALIQTSSQAQLQHKIFGEKGPER